MRTRVGRGPSYQPRDGSGEPVRLRGATPPSSTIIANRLPGFRRYSLGLRNDGAPIAIANRWKPRTIRTKMEQWPKRDRGGADRRPAPSPSWPMLLRPGEQRAHGLGEIAQRKIVARQVAKARHYRQRGIGRRVIHTAMRLK